MAAEEWTLHHVRVIALSDEDKIKAERLVKEFLSLLKANGLRPEHAVYPVSGHRGLQRGHAGVVTNDHEMEVEK